MQALAHTNSIFGMLPDAAKNRKPLRGSAIIAAMAKVMVEHGDGCTERDLRLAGFTQSDLDKHGPTAAERANLAARRN